MLDAGLAKGIVEKMSSRGPWPAPPGVRSPPTGWEKNMRFLGYTLGDPSAPVPPPSPELMTEMGKVIEEATKADVLVATGVVCRPPGPAPESPRRPGCPVDEPPRPPAPG